jgi:hypothetical protein
MHEGTKESGSTAPTLLGNRDVRSPALPSTQEVRFAVWMPEEMCALARPAREVSAGQDVAVEILFCLYFFFGLDAGCFHLGPLWKVAGSCRGSVSCAKVILSRMLHFVSMGVSYPFSRGRLRAVGTKWDRKQSPAHSGERCQDLGRDNGPSTQWGRHPCRLAILNTPSVPRPVPVPAGLCVCLDVASTVGLAGEASPTARDRAHKGPHATV